MRTSLRKHMGILIYTSMGASESIIISISVYYCASKTTSVCICKIILSISSYTSRGVSISMRKF